MANLHYLVAEDKQVKPHEIPTGWGLLIRRGETLLLTEQPAWQEIAVEEQLVLLQRIASRGWRLRMPRPENRSSASNPLQRLRGIGLHGARLASLQIKEAL